MQHPVTVCGDLVFFHLFLEKRRANSLNVKLLLLQLQYFEIFISFFKFQLIFHQYCACSYERAHMRGII